MSSFNWLGQDTQDDGYDATSNIKGIIKLSGNIGGTADNPVVVKINNATIPAAGSLIPGNIIIVSEPSTLTYGSLNLTNPNSITGILPLSHLPNATTSDLGIIQLTNDLGGISTSPSVLKINGVSVAPTPSSNQILIATNSTSSFWSLITNDNISNSAAIASTKLFYSDVISPVLGASTVQGAIDVLKVQTASTTVIQKLTQNITKTNLNAAGGSPATFNIGSVLPANAKVLGAEINVTQALSATLLIAANATIQGTGDSVGSLISSVSVMSAGTFRNGGSNPYLSRGGQQLTLIISLTGASFSALTAGALTVNVFYTVI